MSEGLRQLDGCNQSIDIDHCNHELSGGSLASDGEVFDVQNNANVLLRLLGIEYRLGICKEIVRT